MTFPAGLCIPAIELGTIHFDQFKPELLSNKYLMLSQDQKTAATRHLYIYSGKLNLNHVSENSSVHNNQHVTQR